MKDETMKHKYVVENLKTSYIVHPVLLLDIFLRETKTPLGLKKVSYVWLRFPVIYNENRPSRVPHIKCLKVTMSTENSKD